MMRKVQVRVFDGSEWEVTYLENMGGTSDFLFSTNGVMVFVTDMRGREEWSASTLATFSFAIGTWHKYESYLFEAGWVEQESAEEETPDEFLGL